MLSKFYSSMERYAYASQSLAFLSRITAVNSLEWLIQQLSNALYMRTERCSPRTVSSLEYSIAQSGRFIADGLIGAMLTFLFVKSDSCLFVYIRTSPEVCLGRIRKRAREGEQDIDLSIYATFIPNTNSGCHLCLTSL